MSKPKPKKVEVFRPGTFTSMDGTEITFSAEDVSAIATAYNRQSAPAPVVVGHPRHDSPAYGWADNFSINDEGKLIAEIDDLTPSFVEAVTEGRYRKISMAFFTPDHPANPMPGQYYAKHIGFLGGAAPAVTGLEPVKFEADDDAVIIDYFADAQDVAREAAGLFRNIRDFVIEKFGLEKANQVLPQWRVSWIEEMGLENEPEEIPNYSTPTTPVNGEQTMPGPTPEELATREANLAAREAEMNRTEAASFVDALIEAGTLLPAQKDDATELLAFAEGASQEVAFADGTKKSASALVKDLLGALGKQVDFSTRANPQDDTQPNVTNFAANDGSVVDEDSALLDAKAKEFQAAHPGVTYLDAVHAVQNQ